ncbi:MAG: RNase adapter RapZ [Clostridia bacterium]|nr:RNase adapter RapZ [Clostridia bacterium]
MKIECRSFGFKNGADSDADFVFDVRCLPNPYYIPELKNKTGRDKAVRDYVLGFEQSQKLLQKIVDMLSLVLPLNKEKGRDSITISFGCTGGHHRSVTFAITVCEQLCNMGYDAGCVHRDIDIED